MPTDNDGNGARRPPQGPPAPRPKFVPRTQRPGYKPPVAQSNGSWNNEFINPQIIAEANAEGVTGDSVGRYIGRNTNYVNDQRLAAVMGLNGPAPTGPGGGGSGSGGGDGGAAARNAIATLFAQYQRPDDGVLQGQLNGFADAAGAVGSQSTQALLAMLGGQSNAYTNKFEAPTVAANPMADYMAQTGASTSQVEAMRTMLASQNANSAAADQMMNDRQGQSWQAGQDSRVADANTASASFQANLAANKAAMQSQLAAAEKKKKDDLMQQILQMSVNNNVDLAAQGVTF